MVTIGDAVPCSVCGKMPILQGGRRAGRLACPNYRNDIVPGHGNLGTNGLPMGFTEWSRRFWSEEQAEKEGIPAIVAEWNEIHGTKVE